MYHQQSIRLSIETSFRKFVKNVIADNDLVARILIHSTFSLCCIV